MDVGGVVGGVVFVRRLPVFAPGAPNTHHVQHRPHTPQQPRQPQHPQQPRQLKQPPRPPLRHTERGRHGGVENGCGCGVVFWSYRLVDGADVFVGCVGPTVGGRDAATELVNRNKPGVYVVGVAVVGGVCAGDGRGGADYAQVDHATGVVVRGGADDCAVGLGGSFGERRRS